MPTSREPTGGHNSQNYDDLVKAYVEELLHTGAFLRQGLDAQVSITFLVSFNAKTFYQGKTNNFNHPCLQAAISQCFYEGTSSLARKFKKEFKDKVPLGVLALVATMVEFLISL